MSLKEDDLVLCTVKSSGGTTVFLEIDGYKDYHATIVFSEVAAGRIRNLREYVSPGKKIVCKVLKVFNDHIELSLRRVTSKEREEVLERNRREHALRNMLKNVAGNPDEIIGKIKEKYDIFSFFDGVKDNPKILKEFLSDDKIEKLAKAFNEKESRKQSVKKRIILKSFSETGMMDIKSVLEVNAEIHYLGSSVFSVSVSGKDFKEANHLMSDVLNEIEKRAKNKKIVFEVAKEK